MQVRDERLQVQYACRMEAGKVTIDWMVKWMFCCQVFRQFTDDQCLKPGDEVVACACLAYNGSRLYNVGVVERRPIESVAKGRVGRDGYRLYCQVLVT